MTAGGPTRRLSAIAEEVRAHRGCGFEVCEAATHLVPGDGPADAEVVFVGEAPGASEDRAGRPFVGSAGRLLDRLLAEAGLVRERVYVTNVVKARPPKNRDPRRDEVAHHLPWLLAELDALAPRAVVPLGRHALAHFAPDVKISEAHGRPLERDGRLVFPWYHPAAALHNQSLRETLHVDAQALAALLQNPPWGTYTGSMTSERATAYGRIVATIEDLGAAKLQSSEVDRLRCAADTLIFSETLDAPGAREALDDVEALIAHLVESERWTEERARRLFDDVAECGPLTPVG